MRSGSSLSDRAGCLLARTDRLLPSPASCGRATFSPVRAGRRVLLLLAAAPADLSGWRGQSGQDSAVFRGTSSSDDEASEYRVQVVRGFRASGQASGVAATSGQASGVATTASGVAPRGTASALSDAGINPANGACGRAAAADSRRRSWGLVDAGVSSAGGPEVVSGPSPNSSSPEKCRPSFEEEEVACQVCYSCPDAEPGTVVVQLNCRPGQPALTQALCSGVGGRAVGTRPQHAGGSTATKHLLCLSCARGIKSQGGVMRCPICRADLKVGNEWVLNFCLWIVNFFANRRVIAHRAFR